MKKVFFTIAAAWALATCLHTANANELIAGTKPAAFTRGEPLASGSTLNGYALYPGDGDWRVDAVATSEGLALGEAQTIQFGRATFQHIEPDGRWLATMWVKTNLNQGSLQQFFTGNPCEGQHAFSESRVAGRDDDCLMIDADSYQNENDAVAQTYLRIYVTQTRSSGRLYALVLDFKPDMFGFRNTKPGNWMPLEINENPQRKAFMVKVQKYARQLRDAVGKALAYNKPQNAFDAVPSFRSLMPYPADLADGTYPQHFVSAVQDVKNSKGFKAMAYSRFAGTKISWWSTTEQASQEVANTLALERCEQKRQAGSEPCALYDVNKTVDNVDAVAQKRRAATASN